MRNLKSNSDKILNIAKSFYKGSVDADGNYYFYLNKPKMSDCEIIVLSLVSENIYLVDSIPIPICNGLVIFFSSLNCFGQLQVDVGDDFIFAGKKFGRER